MTIKYVVFDWDGTLADTYPVISAAYNHTFDSLKMPRIPYDEVKQITSSLQNKDTLEAIFGERRQEAAEVYYAYIGKHHATELAPILGAQKVLEYCRSKGIKNFLITNKKTRYVAEEIDCLGFAHMFDKVISAGAYAEDKPHPLATHAVFGGNLPPADEILVLGDGEADYQTARTYDHDGKTAYCVIYDPTGKYQGAKPNHKITDLTTVITLIEKNNHVEK